MRSRRALSRFSIILAALFLLLSPALSTQAAAHDLPLDVLVKMYVKPEGHTLKVLMRMPLKSVQDAEYPRKAGDYVDLTKVDPFLRDAVRVAMLDNLSFFEGERQLPAPRVISTRMSLDSDNSFATYEGALAHVMGPALPDSETIYWEQGIVDVLVEYPIQSDRDYFSIHAVFDRLAQHEITAVSFMPPGSAVRAYELEGDAGLVRLDPRWYHAAQRFVVMGFWHILEGTDHLLFLLCLIIPFRRVPPLIPIITAFTVAHSITLIASAYNIAPDAEWFPPLIETLIAVSIFYMALENIVVENPA
ncbi:MAG TPA: HupE/UreJ family protein, partial [Rhizomicrobium sp.]|nr:HupE/UreJ family protein [Rhizomicrobium sp.]